jgi:hypothetical protein
MRFVGSVSASFSKKIQLKEEDEKSRSKKNEIEIQNDFNEKYKTNIIKQDEINIRRIPYFFWTLGFLFDLVGGYLLYSLIVGPNSDQKLFNGLDHG